MIIGRSPSADGGIRRRPIRHTQIVDEKTRLSLVDYLKERVYKKCMEVEWVGYKDIFPDLLEDIRNTPLWVIYELCYEKFKYEPQTIRINVSKYIGMLVREAVYYSEEKYKEELVGSVRKYRLESK